MTNPNVILSEFCEAYRNGKSFDLKQLYEALCYLGYSNTPWSETHDQNQLCANDRCKHPYYRHFDTYADMEPVVCKYCNCSEFIESD